MADKERMTTWTINTWCITKIEIALKGSSPSIPLR